jgi:hypothetical protein
VPVSENAKRISKDEEEIEDDSIYELALRYSE